MSKDKLCHTKRFLQEADSIKEISQDIIARMKNDKKRFFANDNISSYIQEGELDLLVKELTLKFIPVLKTLLIDIDNDPNSEDTAYRLAKMYVKELLQGRFYASPECTNFPNSEIEGFESEEGSAVYKGMLTVRAELKSICSHHWQPVTLEAYIAILPDRKLIGLSKYIRIAQWVARRGTLQEQLCNQIAYHIKKDTQCENVAVYLEGFHGCCENRGVMANSSLTQTVSLSGVFHKDDVKREFFDNIKLQKINKRI